MIDLVWDLDIRYILRVGFHQFVSLPISKEAVELVKKVPSYAPPFTRYKLSKFQLKIKYGN